MRATDLVTIEPTAPVDHARDRASRTSRAHRRELWKLALVLLVLTTALRLPAFFVDVFNSDETFLATQAQVIRDGGDLYREAADRKPPLVPYLYAGTFELFGTDALWTVRLVAMLAVTGTAVMLAAEARRRYGRRAMWIAGVLCVTAMVAFAPQDGQAANFEVFMLPAMTAAILLARRGRGVASGLGVAVATLAKQTGAATLLPVFFLLARTRGKRGVVEAGLGFALPIAMVALAMGPKQVAYWTVLGNGSYVGLETVTASVVAKFLLMTIAWLACNLFAVWKLPRAWRDRSRPAEDGLTDADLWLWLASGVMSVAIGLRFFGHYYMQLVPPICLLSAGALARASKRGATLSVALAATASLAFSGAGYFMRPFGAEPPYRAVSRYLNQHADPTDRVLVWGNVPEIYWASDLRPATRFPATLSFLADVQPGRERPRDRPVDQPSEDTAELTWTWFYRDLDAHPPRFIIDTAPAAIRGADQAPISRYPRLQTFVQANYRFARAIQGIDIYVRKA